MSPSKRNAAARAAAIQHPAQTTFHAAMILPDDIVQIRLAASFGAALGLGTRLDR
jgi:hypothetical protein